MVDGAKSIRIVDDVEEADRRAGSTPDDRRRQVLANGTSQD